MEHLVSERVVDETISSVKSTVSDTACQTIASLMAWIPEHALRKEMIQGWMHLIVDEQFIYIISKILTAPVMCCTKQKPRRALQPFGNDDTNHRYSSNTIGSRGRPVLLFY